jgi:photosystem II stability/assembly factor-like uncharacterized protein
VFSTDGGASWNWDRWNTSTQDLSAVSCPSASVCEAVGRNNDNDGVIERSTDRGRSWTIQPTGIETGALASISCPTSASCTAVGSNSAANAGVILRSTDGGGHWSSTSLPSGDIAVSVSCFSASDCELVDNFGDVWGSEDGGAFWQEQRSWSPSEPWNFAAIACSSVSTCEIVGSKGSGATATGAAWQTTDGGRIWSQQPVPSAFQLTSVSCPVSHYCVAAGYTRTGGAVVLRLNA